MSRLQGEPNWRVPRTLCTGIKGSKRPCEDATIECNHRLPEFYFWDSMEQQLKRKSGNHIVVKGICQHICPEHTEKNGDFIWESLKDSTLSQWSKFLSIIRQSDVGYHWQDLLRRTHCLHDILIQNAQTYCLHEKTGMPEQRSVLVIMRSVFFKNVQVVKDRV